jgi:hypothetical protein
MPQDAPELCSLIIVGDTKSIVVDTDGDVDDVIHGSQSSNGTLGVSGIDPLVTISADTEAHIPNKERGRAAVDLKQIAEPSDGFREGLRWSPVNGGH